MALELGTLQAMGARMKLETAFWTADGNDIMNGEHLVATVWHELDESEKVAQDIVVAVNFRGVFLDLITVMGELLGHFGQLPDEHAPPPELTARYGMVAERFGDMNKTLLPKQEGGA